MKKHFIHLMISAILGILAVQAQASTKEQKQSSTLEQLWHLAEQNHPQLSYLKADQALSFGKLQELEAQLRPQVKLASELSYTVTDNKDYPRFANRLTVNYPLFDPMLERGKEIALSDYQAQEYLFAAGEQQIRLAIARTFYAYWQKQAQWDYLHQEKDFLIDLLFQIEERMQLGLEALDDLAQVESRLHYNQKQRQQLNSELATLENNLRELVGIADRPEIPLPSLQAPQAPAPAPLSEEDILEKYLSAQQLTDFSSDPDLGWLSLVEQNPRVKAIDQQILSAEQKIHQQKAFETPKVEAFSSLVYNESDKQFYDDMAGIKAGIRIEAPIYLAGEDKARIAQARAELLKLQAMRRKEINAFSTRVHNLWQQLTSRYQQLSIQQKALKSTRCYLEAIEQALSSGDSDIIELLDAQRQVDQVQSTFPELEAEIGLLEKQLLWTFGRLDFAN
ncbi:TolC family protein [Thiomicrorhabdus xiamenensis]|uniref:TolC family protein n=1 Tax=Thiomicrorhabdus xiamenensis TaxID=2739063 RepID=A0A7D4T9A3_9GAMM|nr:TolC family protein [Thiomicrorhabdus xiamenensis]QKI88386.1 TolC family protein [Thiomicrorhabdus xiamenensis]